MVTTPGGFSDDHLARDEREALDLAVPLGTRIIAKHGGVVTQSGYLGTAGNAVTIELDWQGHHYLSRECHLSQCLVGTHDTVVAGQRIGLSGNTGRSDGSHLHTFTEVDGVRLRLEDYWRLQ